MIKRGKRDFDIIYIKWVIYIQSKKMDTYGYMYKKRYNYADIETRYKKKNLGIFR